MLSVINLPFDCRAKPNNSVAAITSQSRGRSGTPVTTTGYTFSKSARRIAISEVPIRCWPPVASGAPTASACRDIVRARHPAAGLLQARIPAGTGSAPVVVAADVE